MTTHWFFEIFIFCYFIHESGETALTLLNNAHAKKHQGEIPEYFRGKIDLPTYQKGIRYNLEKSHFGLVVQWLGVVITWTLLLGGGFDLLEQWLQNFSLSPLLHSISYCLLIFLALMVVKIPVSLYSQFVIEKKYGFNKMTLVTFVTDLIKTLLLSAVLGIPLLALVFWLYSKAGSVWWVWTFASVFGFELLIAAVYPTWLAPIFNKFTPLPDGLLKQSILELAKKIQFKMSGIYTIDGSKRSSHSNAYFAGMGRMRRIVLFDTLQKQINEKEILAVLGHEMGHNKKKHIQKQLILSFIVTFIGFWILSLAMDWEPFYQAFNAGSPAPHKGLILFALFSGHFTFLLPILTNYLSRKYEYEADRFSVEVVGDAPSMASSLVALCRENLSNLTPHPWYSFYHYTHPTTVERVRALTTERTL